MGKTIIVKGADFSANAIDTTTTKCRITYAFTNINASSKPSSVNVGASLSIQLTTSGSYTYPDTVSVTNKNTGAAISGVTYNPSTGLITISAVTVDIIIAATGKAVQGALAITYALTHVDAPNQPTSYVSGNTISIQFSKATGYGYPSSVTVTNTTTSDVVSSGVSYNASTGLLTITGATVPLTITAEGVEEEQGELAASYTQTVCTTGGGVSATTGAYGQAAGSTGMWGCSPEYDVSGYSRFTIQTSNTRGNTFGLAWYDANHNYTGGIIYSGDPFEIGGVIGLDTANSGNGSGNPVKYCRFCCKSLGNYNGEATLNFYE